MVLFSLFTIESKQSYINIIFFNKCLEYGINYNKINIDTFNKLKNNDIKLYNYLEQLDEKIFLDLIFRYYNLYS